MLAVPYAEHAASFSPEIVALVDDDSIYSYNLPRKLWSRLCGSTQAMLASDYDL